MTCEVKYKGKEYTFDEYVALLESGELDALIESGDIDTSVLKGDMEGSKKEEKKTEKQDHDTIELDSPKKLRTVAQSFYDSDMPEGQREALASRVENFVEVTSFEELEAVGKEFIEGLGGIEKAVAEADKSDGVVPARLKTLVYGEAIKHAQKMRKEAKTKKEKNKWADKEVDYLSKLARVAYDAGLANAYINEIYQASPYALVRMTQKKMDEKNRILAPNAEKNADTVKAIIEDDSHVIEAIEEAVAEAVETSNKERDARIAELEKKIAEFGKIKNVVPKKRNYRITDDAKNKAITAIKNIKNSAGPAFVLASPLVNPELYKNLGTIAAYYLERGYYKFEDFYKKMKREVKDHEEYYADLYNEAKQVAIENGIEAKEFTDDMTVEQMADEFYELNERLKAEADRLKADKKEFAKYSKAGIDKAVKDAFIESGFGKEVSDGKGGKRTVVDWKKVANDSKDIKDTIEKIRKALEGKVPADAAATFLDAIEKRAEELVKEKKVNAVNQRVKRFNRYRTVANNIKRRTKIEDLIDIWKEGGLSNSVILDKLGFDFGFTRMTAENMEWIDAKIEEIDNAQVGAERALLEEQLQAYLEAISAPLISLKRTVESMKSRLLSGPVTFVKNILGGHDAQLAALHKTLFNQIANLKEGSTDREILKVIRKSHKKAYWTMMDILLNGGVDTGIALAETTHDKSGFPSVRYSENQRRWWLRPAIVNILGKNLNVNPLNWEKYPQRAMAAADAFSQIMLQEVGSYSFIKNELMKNNPNMSAKEASRKAYEIAFSVEIEDAIIQAAKEFAERGIDLSDDSKGVPAMSRFNRRVHEIVEQQREKNAVESGALFGKRYTYKAADMGVFSAAGQFIAYLKNFGNFAAARLYNLAKETNSPTTYRAAQLLELTWTLSVEQVTPFVKSVANIMEKAMEFTAYGYYKAAAYGTVALYNKLLNKNSLNIDFERASEYSFRATIGTLVAYGILALADRDEEDEELPAIYGAGTGDWRKDAIYAQKRPKNTIKIGGRNVSLEFFGPYSMMLKKEATGVDAIRNNAQSESALLFLASAMDDQYFQKTARIASSAVKSLKNEDDESFKKLMQSESAEFLTRAFLPFTSASRQIDGMRDSEQKLLLSFGDYIAKNSGIYFGWNLDRKAFDYRGRKVDSGNIYTSGAAGAMNLIKNKKPNIDMVDEFVMKYAPAITQISDKDESLVLPDENYQYRPIGSIEFTKVKEDAAKKFDKLITLYVDTDPESYTFADVSDESTKGYEQAYREAQKELKKDFGDDVDKRAGEIYLKAKTDARISRKVSELNSLAKNAAIEDYLNSVNGRIPVNILGSKAEYESVINLLQKPKE